ncbi:hypothetical protein JOE09_002011 [Pantoea coffeiphila]|nr:hypothetical protein [Pantoea coffeiphila]
MDKDVQYQPICMDKLRQIRVSARSLSSSDSRRTLSDA